MAAIPGFRLDLTGASGSQGLLSPRNGWQAYVFPRGGNAAQDSTGTLITFDSSAIASRFAVNNWIQVGTATSKIVKVTAVGGNSMSVNAAVTVTENDRVFLIGNTQPSVSGGSATYITPNTLIRQRGDDAADLYSNSLITSNTDGLIQGYASPAMYDVLVQDGNQSNQGYVQDMEVGTVEGVSVTDVAYFGATVTFSGPTIFGVTATFTGISVSNVKVGTLIGTTAYIYALGVSTFNSTRYINRFATAGTGTSASLWTGWESAVLEGWDNYFPTGFYGTTNGLSLGISSNNQPSRTTIRGDGFQSSSIVGTSDVIILRVRGTQGSPTTQQCTIEGIDVCTNVTNTQSSGMVSFEGGDTYVVIRDLSIRNRNATNTTSFAVTKAMQLLDCQQVILYNPLIRSMTETVTPISTGLHITADDANQRGNITVIGGMINNAIIGIRVNTTGSNSLNNNLFLNTKLVLANTVSGSTAVFLDSQADQQSFNNLHIERYETAYGIVGAGPDCTQIIGGIISGASYGVVATTVDGLFISAPRMATVTYGVSIGGVARNVYWFQGRMDSVTTPWTNATTTATNAPVRINGGRWLEDVYTFGAADPVPNVALGSLYRTANGSSTIISQFTNGIAGQRITVIFGDTYTSVAHTPANGIMMRGGATVTPGIDTTRSFLLRGTSWYETS